MTKPLGEYTKAYNRALRLYTEWALAVDQNERLDQRTKEALLNLDHWSSHEQNIAACPFCERFPPLSY